MRTAMKSCRHAVGQGLGEHPCYHWIPKCLVEFSVMVKVFCISASQYGSCEPRVSAEHLKWGWCDQRIELFIVSFLFI